MKLLALRCPNCSQKLTPNSPEVIALRCTNCGTAVTISDTGIDSTDLKFAAAAVEKIDAWLPLWLFNGRVHIQSRQTQGGSRKAKQASEQLWGYPRRLYVPAWEIPTKQASQIGGDLVQRQPDFQQAAPPANIVMVEAIVSPEDALKLLEFVVFNVEAARKDWLKDLQFSIKADAPQLWAIPAQKAGNGWRLRPLLQ
jgi:ribosomal protein S27E